MCNSLGSRSTGRSVELASTAVFRALLSHTNRSGPLVAFVVECLAYVALLGCFCRFAWLQVTGSGGVSATEPLALYCVCAVVLVLLAVVEVAQLRFFRKLEFKGVWDKLDKFDKGSLSFVVFHLVPGRVLTAVAVVVGSLTLVRG